MKRALIYARVSSKEQAEEGFSIDAQLDLLREYAESKVFVLPSEQEGFGIVLVEAMAAGTPVIARDAANSAASSLVRHEENGLLVKDTNDMALALERLLSSDALYDSLVSGGLETAAKYDWSDALTPELEALYEKVAGK